MSLRTRLVLGVGTVLLLALALLGFLGGRSLYDSRKDDLSAELLGQWQTVQKVADVTSNFNLGTELLDGLAAGSEIVDARIYVVSSALNIAKPDYESGFRNMPQVSTYRTYPVVLEQGNWLMVSALSSSGRLIVQVGAPLTSLNRTLELYVRDSVPLLLSIAALALGAVWLVTGSSLYPLERLTRRVARLETPDPIPYTAQGGEVGKLARALEGSLREMRVAREAEQRFLQTASHELRTPVAAMKAELELTLSRREQGVEALEGALRKVYGSAAHLERLTQNLLTLGRVQGLPLRRETLDLLELCGEVTDRMQPLAVRKGLDLLLEGEPFALEGDSLLLARVLENLLFNAIRFTQEGGVTVRVEAPKVVVEDSGPGLPPEVSQGLERAPDGDLGIGLQVVREVVRAHGGTVEMENLERGGGRVVLRFAARREPEKTENA